MPADRYTALAPANVAATLRSLPRRFREALYSDTELDVDEAATLPLSGGVSLLDVLRDTNDALASLQRSLERTVLSDRPELPADVLSAPPAVSGTTATGDERRSSVHTELERLAGTTDSFAGRIDAVPSGDWLRVGAVHGDGEVTALQVAQQAARVGAENLRAVERMMGELQARAR